MNFFEKTSFRLLQIFFLVVVSLFCAERVSAQNDSGDSGGGRGACGNFSSEGSCFLPGTLVQMQDGTQKKIEEVQVGDKVRGYDLDNDLFTDNIVEELESPIRTEWFKIDLDNGKTIKTTSEHPIYVKEYDGWASVDPEATRQDTNGEMITKPLEIGQHLLSSGETYPMIISIIGFSEEVQTYNLKRVSNNNTFFAESTLVHNKGDSGTTTPACSPWSAWSTCAGPCGSIGTQTRDCSVPPSEWGGGAYYTETQSCTTAACPCVPSCACASTTCVGSTCSNGCGGTCAGTLTSTIWNPNPNTVCAGVPFVQNGSPCGTTRNAVGTKIDSAWTPDPSTVCAGVSFTQTGTSCGTTRTATGTKVDTAWTPDPSTVCSGVPFTQTGTSCGTTRAAVGTKVCSGGYCGPQTYSCSAGNVFNTYSDWYSNLCSSGLCNYVLTITNFCGSTQNCGTERCTDSSVLRERCKDGDVYEFQWGKDDSCSTTTGCDTNIYHECPGTEIIKENCESGTVCKMVDENNAECTARSAQWIEN